MDPAVLGSNVSGKSALVHKSALDSDGEITDHWLEKLTSRPIGVENEVECIVHVISNRLSINSYT